MLILQTSILKIKALQKLEKCTEYKNQLLASDTIQDEMCFDDDEFIEEDEFDPAHREVEAIFSMNNQSFDRFEIGDIVEGTKTIYEAPFGYEVLKYPGEVFGFVNGDMILHFAEDIDSADGSVDIYPLKEGYAEQIEDYNPEDYYYIFDPVEDFEVYCSSERALYHAFGADVAEKLLEPIRKGNSSKRILERVSAIEKFMAVCPSCPIIIPLFSLACRQMLEIHNDPKDVVSASAIFCNSDKESVHFSSEVSIEEKDLVRKFMSMSSLFNGDSGMELCKVLCKIHKSEVRSNSKLCDLYKKIYNKFYIFDDENELYSRFLYKIVKVNKVTNVYIPYANSRIIRIGGQHAADLTAEYEDIRTMAFEMYEDFMSFLRSGRICRSCSEWFDKDNYDIILCELPDNMYQVEFLIDKLLSVNYEWTYIVVPASFLGSDDYTELRKRLFNSGRLSGVDTIPDFNIGEYAVISLSCSPRDVIVFSDIHGYYLVNKDETCSDLQNIEDIIDIFTNSNPNPEVGDWRVDWRVNDKDKTGEFQTNGYILNPKYYINPKPQYEGTGKPDYKKLSDILEPILYHRHIACAEIDKDDIILKSSFNLAPANEYDDARFQRIADRYGYVTDKDCLLNYFVDAKGDYNNKFIYWTSQKGVKLCVDNAAVYIVKTDIVDPNYLIHQLYRKETYLQVRQKSTISNLQFGMLTNYAYMELEIPIPSGADSLESQKKIFEWKKNISLCKNKDIAYSLEDAKEKKSYDILSPITIDRDGIVFNDYKAHVKLETKQLCYYIFLLRDFVDTKGNLVDVEYKDLSDYSLEIGKIYHTLKRKSNSYLDDTDIVKYSIINVKKLNDFKELLNNVKDDCSIDKQFEKLQSIVSKINDKIENELKVNGIKDDIIKSYKIPNGKSASRNIKLNVDIHIDNHLLPEDFFKTYNHPNSSRINIINLLENSKDIEKNESKKGITSEPLKLKINPDKLDSSIYEVDKGNSYKFRIFLRKDEDLSLFVEDQNKQKRQQGANVGYEAKTIGDRYDLIEYKSIVFSDDNGQEKDFYVSDMQHHPDYNNREGKGYITYTLKKKH